MTCDGCAYYRRAEDSGLCICPRERDIDLKTGKCSQQTGRNEAKTEVRNGSDGD